MDVANNLHARCDYEDDVTAEGVEFMRRRAAPQIEGQEWTMVSSADWPSNKSREGSAKDKPE